jgi:hypothetical protein
MVGITRRHQNLRLDAFEQRKPWRAIPWVVSLQGQGSRPFEWWESRNLRLDEWAGTDSRPNHRREALDKIEFIHGSGGV